MSVVKTLLDKSVDIADQLELKHVVLVFDRALCAKAQEIQWGDACLRERLGIRMGELHACLLFLAVIEKRMLVWRML